MPAKTTAALLTLCILSSTALLYAQNPPAPASLRVKQGTMIMLELESPLNTITARGGDTIRFQTGGVIYAGKEKAIPSGTRVEGTIISARPVSVNGKDGRAELRIRLNRIVLGDGSSLDLQADEITIKGERAGPGTAATVGNAALHVGTTFAGLQGYGTARMIGGGANLQRVMVGAAMGGSVLSRVLQTRASGSEIDLPQGAIMTTKITRPLLVPDSSRLAKSPGSAGTDSRPDRAARPQATPTAEAPLLVASPEPPNPVDATGNAPDGPSRAQPGVQAGKVPATNETQRPAPDTSTPSADINGTVQAAGAFSMKVDVSLVQIDVVARARSGKPMTALRAEDLRVFDDGQEQQIQRFSRDELPLAVALVVDRSGSVAPQMARIQAAAWDALQQLKKDDAVCLVGFAGTPELLEPLTTDRQRVANRIGGIKAGGGTAIVDAVHETLLYLARVAPERRQAIILISDNQEGPSRLSSDAAVRLAHESGAVIYSVRIEGPLSAPATFLPPFIPGIPGLSVQSPALFGRGSAAVVDTITRETGGEIFDANAGDIHGALAAAVTRLKLRYTLGYAPTTRSNGYHSVAVRLTDRFGKAGADYTILSRTGYFDTRRP